MYTVNHRFCIPTTLCGESFPVSTSNLAFTLSVRSLSRGVPFGFCSGGFSSTAGYGPGNEARLTLIPRRVREASDLHFQDDRSIKLSNRFYPFDSASALRRNLASLSASVSDDRGQRLSAPSGRGCRVTATIPLPNTGQVARKRSRL